MIDNIFPKIHKEGYKFLAISIIATLLMSLFSQFLVLLFILLTVWVYYFFRDPERVIIKDNKFLVSPADGFVSNVSAVKGPKELNLQNESFSKVSIFMNVFNCHVNRSPIEGNVEEIFYKPGKFLNASLDKSSEENERNYYLIKSKNSDEKIVVVQIAGLIARRIVCEVDKGKTLEQGDRIGMIRFGSRVDVYFKNKKTLVKVGQNVIAGESLIAEE